MFERFSDFFFLKDRFLSNYVVPACSKYISGKLRSFSKNFSKNFFHTTLFENFLPNGVSVAAVKKSTFERKMTHLYDIVPAWFVLKMGIFLPHPQIEDLIDLGDLESLTMTKPLCMYKPQFLS